MTYPTTTAEVPPLTAADLATDMAVTYMAVQMRSDAESWATERDAHGDDRGPDQDEWEWRARRALQAAEVGAHITYAVAEEVDTVTPSLAEQPPATCPECRNGKHPNCEPAWDPVTDTTTPCTCTHGADEDDDEPMEGCGLAERQHDLLSRQHDLCPCPRSPQGWVGHR